MLGQCIVKMKILVALLLLNLQHVRCFDSNQNPGRVKMLYNHSLINATFYIHVGNDLADCMQKCKRVRKCKSINYMWKLGICELNDADVATSPEALQIRVGATFTSKADWNFEEPENCDSCSDGEFCSSDRGKKCEVLGCPPPQSVAGATILGNLFSIGTKRLYKCSNGVKQVSVCREDGNWSPVTITCTAGEIFEKEKATPGKLETENTTCEMDHATCGELEQDKGTCGELEIDNAIYAVAETDDGKIEAMVICNSGYVHSGVNKIHCDKRTWKWDRLDQVRCVNIYDGPWTLVYRIIQGEVTNIYRTWKSKSKTKFRKDGILDGKWQNVGIKQVKVDIIDNSGYVAATLIFDGKASTNLNWFSHENLINSSWTDLKTGISVDLFSLVGIDLGHITLTYKGRRYIRWAIFNLEENADGYISIDCSKTVVWLAVMTARYHPCLDLPDDRNGQVIIVFSNNATGTT